jgi:hypothetical protein
MSSYLCYLCIACGGHDAEITDLVSKVIANG